MDSIIYSEPFYSDEKYDHQYRITISNDKLYLDHIKCNEDDINDDCVILIKNLVNFELPEVKKKIQNSIDIRTNKTINKEDKSESLKSIIELYDYLTKNIFN